MRDLNLSALEARSVHDALAYLTHPRRIREDPDVKPLISALNKIRRFADEAFCNQSNCDRPSYAKGMCEPCYRASLRKRRRSLHKASEVA